MCVVALAYEAHPRWRIILAANRDEFHERPSSPLSKWNAPSPVIAGRDLLSGGSWLGVSETGRLAVVTNIRTPEGPQPGKHSRGKLVTDWLEGGDLELAEAKAYNPFHLLVVDQTKIWLISNRPEPSRVALSPGLHTLSNGQPSEPWPRKERLEQAFSAWLNDSPESLPALFNILADEEGANERVGPPLFIRNPVYGTRCSTVVLIDHEGEGSIAERRFTWDGKSFGETRLTFRHVPE